MKSSYLKDWVFIGSDLPLKDNINLLWIEIVELFLEIAASHESVAVWVENIEGRVHLQRKSIAKAITTYLCHSIYSKLHKTRKSLITLLALALIASIRDLLSAGACNQNYFSHLQ